MFFHLKSSLTDICPRTLEIFALSLNRYILDKQPAVAGIIIGVSSRFRVMYLNKCDFSQFHEIAVKKLLAEGLDKKAADEIAISVWEQLPSPTIRNCIQIGRLVKNEPDMEMAIADEITELQRIWCTTIDKECRRLKYQLRTLSFLQVVIIGTSSIDTIIKDANYGINTDHPYTLGEWIKDESRCG